jgi:hypothetical protein
MLTPVAFLLLAFMGLVPSAGVLKLLTPRATAQAAAAGDQAPKGTHQRDFLLFGTVFTEQGSLLPGAEVRVRRAGERKGRWEARSDRRGEFAVRVPQGAEYEISIRATGYEGQTQKIDARTGSREDLVFRLAPAAGRKSK